MKFAQAQGLSKPKFKRLTGMSPRTYYVIVNVVKKTRKEQKKAWSSLCTECRRASFNDHSILARISTLFSDWS